jgi:hypothetical protein
MYGTSWQPVTAVRVRWLTVQGCTPKRAGQAWIEEKAQVRRSCSAPPPPHTRDVRVHPAGARGTRRSRSRRSCMPPSPATPKRRAPISRECEASNSASRWRGSGGQRFGQLFRPVTRGLNRAESGRACASLRSRVRFTRGRSLVRAGGHWFDPSHAHFGPRNRARTAWLRGSRVPDMPEMLARCLPGCLPQISSSAATCGVSHVQRSHLARRLERT